MKRGQSAGGAAALIAIIAGLILIYILILPANEREALLNESSTSTTTTTTTGQNSVNENVLIFEHPGTLDSLTNKEREKILDSFNLYTEKSAIVIKSVDAMHIESGWFRGKAYNLSFKVNDVQNTENYILAYDVSTSFGRLIVSLNGKEIYNSKTTIGNADPIKIDKDLIQAENSLLFYVSDVGAAFWQVNEYNLKNVRMIADFTDTSKKEYLNQFIMTASEKTNLEISELSYVPDCLTKKVGALKISINDKQLSYSAIPDCGSLATISFDPSYLKQGENTVSFRAEEGNYFVDHVKLKLTLKEITYPFYYFELKDTDVAKVENNTQNISLQIKFADKEDKTGTIDINGHKISLLTSNITYSRDIESFISEGQNYLQITPKTNPLNIVDLKVSLVK
jgi:hypothetical protein